MESKPKKSVRYYFLTGKPAIGFFKLFFSHEKVIHKCDANQPDGANLRLKENKI